MRLHIGRGRKVFCAVLVSDGSLALPVTCYVLRCLLCLHYARSSLGPNVTIHMSISYLALAEVRSYDFMLIWMYLDPLGVIR